MLKLNELIDLLVEKTGCTKKEVKGVFDCLFDSIADLVDDENPIKIAGFGTFKVRTTVAKEQVNLITGKAEIVPAHKVVVFKPAFEIDPKPEAIELDMDGTPVMPVPTPVVKETPAAPARGESSNIVWHYDGKECTENNIYQVLRQRTGLSDDAIKVVLAKVNDQAKKYQKIDVTVVEDNDSFQFVIEK